MSKVVYHTDTLEAVDSIVSVHIDFENKRTIPIWYNGAISTTGKTLVGVDLPYRYTTLLNTCLGLCCSLVEPHKNVYRVAESHHSGY